ncbi:PI-PLC X domain-containing protein 3 [Microtus ochrogaster]|uniref:PI-PLC X domain-containing protein 3 n=1 Tax=Microtus ochrogaster TaxID=79684 RepID=A0A8J6H0U4_MICOH|nr:PI-PLC X domain-containing protein 3 [Microtus ochrogaster]
MASSQGKNELKFADWMATLPESIHSIPLTNLAIPGRYPLHLPRPASSYTQC